MGGGNQKDKRGKTAETIDYIFYTKEFECSQVLDITKDTLEHVRMPGWRYPSDHFSIVADLTLRRSSPSRPSSMARSPSEAKSPSRGSTSPAQSPRIVRKKSKPTLSRRCTRSPRSPKPNRRLAQREFSTRRDSPVMARLLDEIENVGF